MPSGCAGKGERELSAEASANAWCWHTRTQQQCTDSFCATRSDSGRNPTWRLAFAQEVEQGMAQVLARCATWAPLSSCLAPVESCLRAHACRRAPPACALSLVPCVATETCVGRV